jgi:hypothetical protein
VREVHKLGSTQLVGKQKKLFDAQQYTALKGREKKKQKVPLKIVREIKKAGGRRAAKHLKEMKDSGVVSSDVKRKKKKTFSEQNRRNLKIHGPAPSNGFMSNGILRIKKK